VPQRGSLILHLPLFLHFNQHFLRRPEGFQTSRHATIRTADSLALSYTKAILIRRQKRPHRFSRKVKKVQIHLACNKASRISTSVQPFLTAPLTCVPSSIHFPNAVNMTRLRRLLVLSSNPGRVQIVPHAISYVLWYQFSYPIEMTIIQNHDLHAPHHLQKAIIARCPKSLTI
jgi:hypothetical protein